MWNSYPYAPICFDEDWTNLGNNYILDNKIIKLDQIINI